MGNTTIPAELVAINAIQGTLIADNAITSVHIAQNNVTAVQIAINAVTATQIADGTITSAKIADGTIVTADIADGQISTVKLVDSSVTSAKIAAATIVSGDIANNAILTQHIDDNQITADQIADNAVGIGQLAGITRGSIIVGDSAGDPSLLGIGSSGHVLTSDGTDVAWTADTDLFLATTGGTITGNLVVSTTSPQLQFQTGASHYNWQIAAQENVNAGFEISSGAADADGTNDTYTPRLVILQSGNVGIGTSSPAQKLHVVSAANQIRIEDSTNNKKYDLNVDSNNFMVDDMSAGVNRFAIKDGGNVGIGTTSPDVKLDVRGEIAVGYDATYGLRFYNQGRSNWSSIGNFATNSTADLNFKTGGGLTMTMTHAKNVGIGTNNPGVDLDVASTAQNVLRLDTTNSDGPLHIFRNNGTVRGYIGNAEGILGQGTTNFGMRAQAALYFGTNGNNTAMTIDTSQRVGIGVTSPSNALSVSGVITSGNFTSVGVGGTPGDANTAELGPGYLNLARDDTADAKQILFGKNGAVHSYLETTTDGLHIGGANVGIGTNDPTFLGLTGVGKVLHLQGTNTQLRLTNSILHHDNAGLTKLTLRNNYGATSSAAQLELQAGFITLETGTSFTERVRVDASGHMMVGTSDSAQNTGAGVKLKYDNSNGRVFTVTSNSSGESFSSYQLNYGYTFYVTNNGKIHTAVGPAVYSVSDERLKENIRDLDKGLTDILKLKPRTFDWKKGEGDNQKNVSGFIAQECEEAGFEEFVGDFKHDTLTDAKSFGHGGLVPALVKAIQELEARIKTLEG